MTNVQIASPTGFCHYHQEILQGGESCYLCTNDRLARDVIMVERAVINAANTINLDEQAALVADYYRALDAFNYHSSLGADNAVTTTSDNDLPF